MTPPVDHQAVEQLRSQVQQLQGELNEVAEAQGWPPSQFSWMEHVVYGAVLGACGAAVALLANVVLAPLAGKYPLELIRVYLTFPLDHQRPISAVVGRRCDAFALRLDDGAARSDGEICAVPAASTGSGRGSAARSRWIEY